MLPNLIRDLSPTYFEAFKYLRNLPLIACFVVDAAKNSLSDYVALTLVLCLN